MDRNDLRGLFEEKATAVGAEVVAVSSLEEAASYVAARLTGALLLPDFASGRRLQLAQALTAAGCTVVEQGLRAAGKRAEGGLTAVNFAIADSGTLVLESTAEDIRLATTLPTKQFALLDPAKIVADGLAAVPFLRQFHQRDPRNYIAYITGPSRTADIERVLTIGVHGPKQLHILLLAGLSDDLLEM